MGGIRKTTQTFTTRISPSRMFKALIVDSHNILPKLMFSSIKSIEFIQGQGEVGTIKQINFTEDVPHSYVRHQICAIDEDKFFCKYRFIEGDILMNILEYITYEIKFEGYGSGGCVCKMSSEYKPKEGVEIQEVDIELGKDKSIGMYEVVEAHLLAHPLLYS